MRFKEFSKPLSESFDQNVLQMQKELKAAGADLGPFGPKGDGLDGIMGQYTRRAADKFPDIAKKYNIVMALPDSPDAPTDKTDVKSGMPANAPVTQPFGKVSQRGTHPGTDLGTSVGTPIHAPISGKVTYAEIDDNDCGGTIAIQNGSIKHRFCHCSSISVHVGDNIDKGDVVGYTGGAHGMKGAGLSTGPHLHWEKYIAGNKVDPMSNIG